MDWCEYFICKHDNTIFSNNTHPLLLRQSGSWGDMCGIIKLKSLYWFETNNPQGGCSFFGFNILYCLVSHELVLSLRQYYVLKQVSLLWLSKVIISFLKLLWHDDFYRWLELFLAPCSLLTCMYWWFRRLQDYDPLILKFKVRYKIFTVG